MNFKQFKKHFNVTDEHLFAEFYDLFKDDIAIKNKNRAIVKLEKIINATFKLSANQSFASMTLRQLSHETEISMGGLYSYIKNKQQLSLYIHQFLNHYVQKIFDQIDIEGSTYPLENLLKSHIYMSEIMQSWFFFAFMESKSLNNAQKIYAKNSELMVEQNIINLIEKGQQLGLYNKSKSAEMSAIFIKPLLHDWYLKRWKYKQKKISIDDFCYSIIEFINYGLKNQTNLKGDIA